MLSRTTSSSHDRRCDWGVLISAVLGFETDVYGLAKREVAAKLGYVVGQVKQD
jgi:hypothetical protein